METTKFYTPHEEKANTLSHAAGILLGLFAAYLLIPKALERDSVWAVVGVVLYLFGMLSSYISSTCYHGCNPTSKAKELLRKYDHAAIYLHIAGTYMPFVFLILWQKGYWGYSLFAFIVLSAIVGVVLSFRNLKKHSNLETICFVVMGASILVALKPLIDALSATGQLDALYWLIAGGCSYIVGALFYSWTKRKYMHFVFHLFVLGGSVCHIVAIYKVL